MNETPKQSKQTSASLAGTFEPSTSLEKTIDSLLRESGLRSEKEIASFEDLALKKVSIDEVRHRRAQLRAMRELMFRQDLKAKRIAKIKSKTYRRIHKKEREREMARQAAEEDSDGEEAMERKMKVETARAKERMTLRHKNTRDWATKMLNRGQHDLETRRAISEQIRRGDELRRKVLGNDEDDEDDEESDSEEDLEELKSIKDPSKWGENPFTMGQEELRKGVMGMKFMQDAEERQKQINAKHLAEIKASLNDGSDAEDLEATANGRKTFVPGDQVFSHRLSSDSKVVLGNPREKDSANRDGKGVDDEVCWKIVKNPFHMDKAMTNIDLSNSRPLGI
jgi:U3 small nucleolar RNA-associated protein 14